MKKCRVSQHISGEKKEKGNGKRDRPIAADWRNKKRDEGGKVQRAGEKGRRKETQKGKKS